MTTPMMISFPFSVMVQLQAVLTENQALGGLLKRKLHEAIIEARERFSQIKAEKKFPALLPQVK